MEESEKQVRVERVPLNDGLATTPRVLGHSRDGRTQRWMVTCPKCDKQFEPQTTRLSRQSMECPKCGIPLSADYNAEPPAVRVANVKLTGGLIAESEKTNE